MNILLTGATGFIGGTILSKLKHSYSIFAPSHKSLDLSDEQKVMRFFKAHAIDVVIHCAVIGGSRSDQYVDHMLLDNLRIFFNIAKCQNYFGRMINIGSGAAYDKRYPIIRVKEESLGDHIPGDAYGLFKYICSDYINHSKKIVDLRIFGIFGEGEDYCHRFISNAMCRQILGLPITMKHNVCFDYLDVLDFVDIVDYFISHKAQYHAYNVGTGRKIDLMTIAKKVVSLGSGTTKIIREKNVWANEYTCNIGRLRREIPQLKFTPMDQSLTRLYAWYLGKKHLIKNSEL